MAGFRLELLSVSHGPLEKAPHCSEGWDIRCGRPCPTGLPSSALHDRGDSNSLRNVALTTVRSGRGYV